MRKKIQSLFMVTILLVSLAVTGCGSNKENAKESNTNATQDSTEIATKVVEKEESATVEEKEDGTIKITTDTGEEIEIASGSSEVKEEADGSKTYTTSDGRKVTVSSDGSATVTTKEVVEAETGKPVNNSGNISNGGASNSNGSSNNSTSSLAGSSDSTGNSSSSSTGNTETACSHSWKSATCTAPKTCTKCGATEGSAKGHTSSDWTVTKEATETTEGTKVKTCTVCGATLETASIAKVAHTCNYQWETNGNTRTMKCSCGATGITEECVAGVWGYFDRGAAEELFSYVNSNRAVTQYGVVDDDGNPIGIATVPALTNFDGLYETAKQRAAEVVTNYNHSGMKTDNENLGNGWENANACQQAWCYSSSHASTMTNNIYTQGSCAVFYYDADGSGQNLYPFYVLVVNK